MDNDWELFRVLDREMCLLSVVVNWPLGGALPKWHRISLVVV
jgi:hypothetical protein